MYPLIMEKLLRHPWLIEPAVHQSMVDQLFSRLGRSWAAEIPTSQHVDWLPRHSPHADSATSPDLERHTDARLPSSRHNFWTDKDEPVRYFHTLEEAPGVARVASLRGIIGKKLTTMELHCGACSLDHFMMALKMAGRDESIHTVILDIDSPGGISTGVPEAARYLRKFAAESGKRVIAFSETKCCSAAQWIAAQAPECYGTPSARWGSIGVYISWLDPTEALEKLGVHRETFEAGDHKAAGLRPLTDAERKIYQAQVEQLHAQFKSAVRAGGRSGRDVPEEACQGLTHEGDEAQAYGLIDWQYDTFDEMLAALGFTA